MTLIDFIICTLYLVLTIVIGSFIGKKQTNTEDYFLAGRSMKWWPIAISLFASLFSAISYIAMPGEGYNFGCTMLLSGLVSVIALPIMLFVFLKFFYKMNLWTINEYLEKRFSLSIRIINSLMFLLIRLVYLGVVLYGTAILLEKSLNWPAWLSILAVGVFSSIYTYLGGMEAVVWTDVFQFIVLLGGVLLVIGIISMETPGGIGGIWSIASEHNRTFDIGFDSEIWNFSLKPRISVWAWLIGLPIAFILPATDQINLQRCLSCKNFKEVARAVTWSTLANLPICFLFYFAGLAVFVYFNVLRPELNDNFQGDTAFCLYISNYLPVGIRGLLSAGVLAAVMSTVDSVQNSLATVFVKDIYQRVLIPNRNEQHYLKVAKISTLIIGVFTCLFGLTILLVFSGRNIPLLEVSNVCLNVLTSFTAGIFVLGLLSYRTNSKGLIVGLIATIPLAIYFTFFRYLFVESEERIGFMFLGMINTFSVIVIGYIASFFFAKESSRINDFVIWSRWK